MRGITVFCFLVILVCGCDPVGIRRVNLQLRAPIEETSSISVDSPDTQAALNVLDSVVFRHGFHLVETEHGYIRSYVLNLTETFEGRNFTRAIPCRVSLMPTGLEVTFGELSLLGSYSAADRVFSGVRNAFIEKYGKKRVQSHVFGAGASRKTK